MYSNLMKKLNDRFGSKVIKDCEADVNKYLTATYTSKQVLIITQYFEGVGIERLSLKFSTNMDRLNKLINSVENGLHDYLLSIHKIED